MTEHVGFVCRREGHVPMLQELRAPIEFHGVVTTCSRCGKVYTVDVEPTKVGHEYVLSLTGEPTD